MSHQPFDFQDLLQLVELMKSTSQFSEFRLRSGDVELELRRGPAAANAPAPAAPASTAPPAAEPATVAAPAAASARPARAPERAAAAGSHVVSAPMLGTVYLAPEPGASAFVTLGQPVEASTQLCIVEVMKLMNSVTAGSKGVVREIRVGDAETVEFGQTLFVIEPA